MNTKQFAARMGVNYCTVTRWIRQKLVPGVTRNWNGKDWDIPEEAVNMVRPRTGPKSPGEKIVRSKRESAAINKLRTELADLNHQHMKLMEKHAALCGRHEHVNELYSRALHDLKHKEMELQLLKEGLDVAESKLRFLESRVDQLEGGKSVPSLSIRGL